MLDYILHYNDAIRQDPQFENFYSGTKTLHSYEFSLTDKDIAYILTIKNLEFFLTFWISRCDYQKEFDVAVREAQNFVDGYPSDDMATEVSSRFNPEEYSLMITIGAGVLSLALTTLWWTGVVYFIKWIIGRDSEPDAQAAGKEIIDLADKYGLQVVVGPQSFDEKKSPDAVPLDVSKFVKMEPQVGGAVPGKVAANLYAVIKRVGSQMFKVGHCLSIQGGLMLYNRHVIRAIQGASILLQPVQASAASKVMAFPVFNPRTVMEEDDAMFVVHTSLPYKRPRLSPHMFVDEKDLDKVPDSGIMISTTSTLELDTPMVSSVKLVQQRTPLAYDDPEMECDMHAGYHWAGSVKAACGSINITQIANDFVITSMHAAGSSEHKLGRGVVITRQMVEKAVKHSCFESQSGFDIISLEDEDVLHGAYAITGAGITTSFKATIPTGTTQFVPTEFNDSSKFSIAPLVSPARLTGVNYRIGLEKERQRDACLNAHPQAFALCEEFKEDILEKFYPAQIETCKRLSVKEALCDFDPTTSRGLRMKEWGMSKKALIGYDGVPQDKVVLAKFEENLEDIYRMSKHGSYLRQINSDKMKDETLPTEFVEAGKARIFNVTDMVDNVMIKQAIGDLVLKSKDHFLFGPASCGVNPCGLIWASIFSHFAGLKLFCSDISGFDYTVNRFFYCVADLLLRRSYPRRRHYLDACWAILSCLQAIRFSYGQGRIRNCGNTSGNWITTWLNTLVNTCYFCVATAFIAVSLGLDPSRCIKRLRLRLYSDDNIVSPCHVMMTPDRYVDAFRDLFGVKLTSVSKGVVDSEFISISEAEFLSRGFSFEGGCVRAPLSEASVLGQLCYVRVPVRYRANKAYVTKQLQQNMDNVMRELQEFPYERATYIVGIIRKFVVENGLNIRCDFTYNTELAVSKLIR